MDSSLFFDLRPVLHMAHHPRLSCSTLYPLLGICPKYHTVTPIASIRAPACLSRWMPIPCDGPICSIVVLERIRFLPVDGKIPHPQILIAHA